MKKSGISEAWMTELVTENTTCQAPWAWNVPQILLFCRFKLDEKFVPFNPSQHTVLAYISHFAPLIPKLWGLILNMCIS